MMIIQRCEESLFPPDIYLFSLKNAQFSCSSPLDFQLNMQGQGVLFELLKKENEGISQAFCFMSKFVCICCVVHKYAFLQRFVFNTVRRPDRPWAVLQPKGAP